MLAVVDDSGPLPVERGLTGRIYSELVSLVDAVLAISPGTDSVFQAEDSEHGRSWSRELPEVEARLNMSEVDKRVLRIGGSRGLAQEGPFGLGFRDQLVELTIGTGAGRTGSDCVTRDGTLRVSWLSDRGAPCHA